MGCVQSREHEACAPCLLGFILLGSFSDTLLCLEAVTKSSWGTYGLCPKSLAWQGRASTSEVYPAGKLQ